MNKKITGFPRWLTLSEDRMSFTLKPENATIIRRIFQMSCGGLGCYTIAKQLNDQNIPAFGTSGRWEQSTIDKMLRNPAVIGDLQPTSSTSKAKRAQYEEPPLPGFYPAAIDDELFHATQVARERNGRTARGRKGSYVTNLFGKMVTCLHCGAPVRFHSHSNSKSMICSTVLAGGACHRFAWACPQFETDIFDTIIGIEEVQPGIEHLVETIKALPHSNKYYARLEIARLLRETIQFLGMAAAGQDPPTTKSTARIRRNRPGRYLEIQSIGGGRRRSKPFD